uniref:BZIP domain-containing protein n=1 Tax=Parastrongyloides trichosuri TaxID=131310 RepID=A0A0N4ZUT1_PARTI
MFGDRKNALTASVSTEKEMLVYEEKSDNILQEENKMLDTKLLLRKKRAEATERYKEALKNPSDPENAKIIAKREQIRLANKLRTAKYRQRQYLLKHSQNNDNESKMKSNNKLDDKRKALEQIEREIWKTRCKLEQLENIKNQIIHSTPNDTILNSSSTTSPNSNENSLISHNNFSDFEDKIPSSKQQFNNNQISEALINNKNLIPPDITIDSDPLKAIGKLSLLLLSNVTTMINGKAGESVSSSESVQKDILTSAQPQVSHKFPTLTKKNKIVQDIDEITDVHERKKALARLRQQRYRQRKAAEALLKKETNSVTEV